jgi:ABC-type sugar transport system permease subunit
MAQVTSPPVVAATGLQRRRRSVRQQIAANWFMYLLLVPTFILLLLFVYYPAGLALVMSLFEWVPGIKNEFVGLRNFERIFSDPLFWKSWINLAWIALWTFTVPFAMPLIVAELIFNLRSPGARGFYRIAILIPTLVPGLVTLQLWRWLYSFPNGGLNLLLGAVGLKEYARPWLGTVDTALPALLFMGFPWIIGVTPLIYLAGLMNMPADIIDASRIDGASTFRRIFAIDIPNLMGQVRLFFVFGIIGLFQGFGTQLVLTQGGPYGATMVPGMYLYIKAFGAERFQKNFTRLGEACAVGVVLFILILIFSYIGHRKLRVSGVEGD